MGLHLRRNEWDGGYYHVTGDRAVVDVLPQPRNSLPGALSFETMPRKRLDGDGALAGNIKQYRADA